ncbi:MAG TPA: sel1 repeat family protein [Acidobacteria bacterium]|nr:sel1 repeat family protein [Acidobacteriota bacterium]
MTPDEIAEAQRLARAWDAAHRVSRNPPPCTPCQSAVGPASTPASGAPLQAQTPEIDALRAGAEQGDASAQSSLGIMYDYGGGVSEDDAVVVRWSPTKGMPARSTASGPCTPHTGRGVVQDYVQAHMWRNLAASRQTGEDRELSVEARDALADLMTPKISAKPNASPLNGTNAPACVNRRYF